MFHMTPYRETTANGASPMENQHPKSEPHPPKQGSAKMAAGSNQAGEGVPAHDRLTPGRAKGADAKGAPAKAATAISATPFHIGYFVGILVANGSFSGDGKQPQIGVRMHTDHEQLFQWLMTHFPGGKLYGPYHHGGRSYFQWIARGPFLRDVLVPLLDEYLQPGMDGKAYQRFERMKADYSKRLDDPLQAIDAKLREMDGQ
jgi:hypothetical protein